MNGMGTHQSAKMIKDEWLTPPEILRELGQFYLDPCAPVVRPWSMAKHHYTIQDDGLLLPWFGKVWLNPPYGTMTSTWLEKLVLHGNGIALIFARTETDMFFRWVWDHASALLFIRGRLYFHHVTGERAAANSGAPSVLIAYGSECARLLMNCNIDGKRIIQNIT